MSTTATIEALRHSTAILHCIHDTYQELVGLSPRRQQPQRDCIETILSYQRGEVERSEVVDAIATMHQAEKALPPRTFEVGEHVYFWYTDGVDGSAWADGHGTIAPPYNPGVTVKTGVRSYCIISEERAARDLRRAYADAAVITRTETGVMLDGDRYPTLAAALRAASALGYRKWYGNAERWPDTPRRIPPHYRSRDEILH